MKVVREVEFTKEEQEAINLIAKINCGTIACWDCAFYKKSTDDYCTKNMIRDIAIEGGFYEQNN